MEYVLEEIPSITFEEIEKMPRREAIITIADKFSDIFLDKYTHPLFKADINRLAIERDIFNNICRRLNCYSDVFYKFCHFKLKMVGMRNDRPNDVEYASQIPNEEIFPNVVMVKEDAVKELKIKDLREKAFYTGTDVWKVLAYYCQHLSPAAAKNVLLKIEKYHYGKKYNKMKEIFTSTLIPDGLKYLPFVVAEKIKEDERGKHYRGLLAGKRGNLINPHIDIFVKRDLDIGKTYLGVKKQPHRNIIVDIIE